MSGNEAQEATVKWLADVARSILTLAAAATMLVTGTWWLLEPRFKPWLDVPENLAALELKVVEVEARIARLSANLAPRDAIEFQPFAVARPTRVKAGDRIAITYSLRRNEPCETAVNARWYSVTMDGVAPEFSSSFPAARAPVTQEFNPQGFVVTVPDLPSGEWAYAPELVPGGECAGDPPIYPPPAYFEVIE